MLNRNLPAVVYHADWGSNPSKRWLAKAVLERSRYIAHPPEPVGDDTTLIVRARANIGRGSAMLGFDFPIGIPIAYARLIGATEFKTFLSQLGRGELIDFYRVCSDALEITKYRPFYPYKPGGTKQKHLLDALEVTDINDLRRKCELGRDGRKAACSLFWTLGPNQVGKAAIIGWRDVLAPALGNDKSVVLWPFDGSLDALLKPGNVVMVETYPAECYGWFLQGGLKGKKGDAKVRRKAAGALFKWAGKANVRLDPDLLQTIEQGFPDGDDAFDAIVGLFGMLEALMGRREPGDPSEEGIRKVEGWILGQQSGSGGQTLKELR
jgi:hypothetical protein